MMTGCKIGFDPTCFDHNFFSYQSSHIVFFKRCTVKFSAKCVLGALFQNRKVKDCMNDTEKLQSHYFPIAMLKQ